jgi:hypothetical protein
VAPRGQLARDGHGLAVLVAGQELLVGQRQSLDRPQLDAGGEIVQARLGHCCLGGEQACDANDRRRNAQSACHGFPPRAIRPLMPAARNRP